MKTIPNLVHYKLWHCAAIALLLPSLVDAAVPQFTELEIGFTGSEYGALDWGDFDADGDLDLLVAGVAESGRFSTIYRNDGLGEFVDTHASLAGVEDGSLKWGDYDNDRDLDIAMSGLIDDSGLRSTRIYRCDGGGVFTEILTNTSPYADGGFSDLEWVDFDGDGDLDLVLGSHESKIYVNHGHDLFTDSGQILNVGYWTFSDYDLDGDIDALHGAEILDNRNGVYWHLQYVEYVGSNFAWSSLNSWVNLDNDAYPEGVVSGWLNVDSTLKTVIVDYDEKSGLFRTVDTEIPGVPLEGDIRCGDYDNDGDVDLLMVCAETTGRTLIAENVGSLTFVVHVGNLPQLSHSHAVWGDFDNDHDLDIAISGTGIDDQASTRIYENVNTASNTPPTTPYGLVTEDLGERTRFSWSGGDLYSALRVGNSPGGTEIASPQARLSDGMRQVVDYGKVPGDLDLLPGRYYWSVQSIDAKFEGSAFAPEQILDVPGPQLHDIHAELSPTERAALDWGDFDADGDLDLLIAGVDEIGRRTIIYRNDGAGEFVDVVTSLRGLEDGALTWNDYDNDNDLDITLYGIQDESGLYKLAIYRNEGNSVFSEVAHNIPSVPASDEADVDWGDIDGDGDYDLVISGGPARICINNGNDQFAIRTDGFGNTSLADFDNDGDLDAIIGTGFLENRDGDFWTIQWMDVLATHTVWTNLDSDAYLEACVTGLALGGGSDTTLVADYDEGARVFNLSGIWQSGAHLGSIDCGDIDNDDDTDIVISGCVTGSRLVVGLNDGSASFEFFEAGLPQIVAHGAAALGDFDGDHDLDLAIVGADANSQRVAAVFANDWPKLNDPPSVPANLTAESRNGRTRFLWTGGELYSDLRIGTVPGGVEVASPMARLSDGERLVVDYGKIPSSLELAPGRYYWSVQSIDARYAGSPFAPEVVVEVNQFVEETTTIPGVWKSTTEWGDYDRDGDLDVYICGLSGVDSTTAISRIYRNDDGLFRLAADLTPGVYSGDAQWGDYDRDGDIDLIVAGESADNSVTTLYENRGDGDFSVLDTALPVADNGAVAWGDYDADGDLDLLLTGGGADTSPLYRNDGGQFSREMSVMPNLRRSSGAWGDCDDDGDLDVVTFGDRLDGSATTNVYRNDGAGVFVDYGAQPWAKRELQGFSGGEARWGDLDLDGDLDLLLTGNGTLIYRNDGMPHVELVYGLTGLADSAADCGDYDGDGDLDILISGTTWDETKQTLIYQNDGSGQFADTGIVLPGVSHGTVNWIDYDGDGDLDLFVTGSRGDNSEPQPRTALYRNTAPLGNSPPTAPSGLTSQLVGSNTVALGWLPSADDHIPAAAIHYDLRVGTRPGFGDIVTPNADLPGYCGKYQTTHTFLNLGPGTYYWSVIAWDTAGLISEAAPEESFTIARECAVGPVLYVAPSGVDKGGPGESWSSVYRNVSDALVAARICPEISEIWVKEGIYLPTAPTGDRTACFAVPAGVKILGGFVGTETDPAMRDILVHPTILSGDIGVLGVEEDNCYHVVVGTTADAASLLDGVVITGGHAGGAAPADNCGGGVYVGGGSLVLSRVIVRDNSSGYGGGMHVAGGDPVVYDSEIHHNTCDNRGGGLALSGGQPGFFGCTVIENESTGSGGGFASTQLPNSDATAKFGNTIIWGNRAPNWPEIEVVSPNLAEYEHCLLYGTGGSSSEWGGLWGTDLGGNIDAVPEFRDAATGDYRPTNNSPVVEGGVVDPTYTSTIDLAGEPRIVYRYPDIGARELQDGDGDGIPDYVDRDCPAESSALFDRDGDGCPDEVMSARHVEYLPADSTLTFVVNEEGAPGIEGGADFAALAAAFQTWSGVAGTAIAIDPTLETTPQRHADALDGMNLVTFTDDTDFGPSVIALGLTTSFTQPSMFEGRLVRPGEIVDADMLFNPHVQFSVGGGGGPDLQSVATHEIGHWLGLSHSAATTSTMYPVLQTGGQGRSLEIEDVQSLFKAYPDSATLAGGNQLHGHVLHGTTQEGVAGAAVFVVDAVTEQVVGCDYTLVDGSYQFRRLPAGTYYLYIHPLDGGEGVGGLTPPWINDYVAENADLDFIPEYWDVAESGTDDAVSRDPFAIGVTDAVERTLYTNQDVTGPLVMGVTPADGTAGIPISSAILVEFDEPIDINSVPGSFSVTDTTSGAGVAGVATSLFDGSVMSFLPNGNFEFATTYRLAMNAGILDPYGNPLQAPFRSDFTTQVPAEVELTGVAPTRGVEGTVVALTGIGFSIVPGENSVVVGGVAAIVGSASATRLTIRVPAEAQSGMVTVTVAGHTSGGRFFQVIPPDGAPRGYLVGEVALTGLPREIEVTADGRTAFVTTSRGLTAVAVDPDTTESDWLSMADVYIDGGLTDVAITPDNQIAYAVSEQSRRLVTLRASPPIYEVASVTLDASPRGILVGPTGRRAYIPTDAGEIQIWDLTGGLASGPVRVGTLAASDLNLRRALAVDPLRDRLLALTGTDSLLVFDLSANAQIRSVHIANDPRDIVVDQFGLRAYIVCDDGDVTIVDLEQLVVVGEASTGGRLRGAAVSPASSYLYAVDREYNLVDVFDIRTASAQYGSVVLAMDVATNPVAIALAPDGGLAFTLAEEGRKFCVHAVGSGPLIRSTSPPAAPPGGVIVITGAGFASASEVSVLFGDRPAAEIASLTDSRLAVTVPSGAVSGSLRVRLTDGDSFQYSNAVPIRILAPTVADGLRLAGLIEVPEAAPLSLAYALDPEDDFLLVGDHSGMVRLLDLTRGHSNYFEFVSTIATGANVSDLAMGPDRSRVLVTDGISDRVRILSIVQGDLTSSALADSFELGGGVATSATVTPDGLLALVIDAESSPSGSLLHVATIADTAGTLGVLDVGGGVGLRPQRAVVHPAGEFAYLPAAGPTASAVQVVSLPDRAGESPQLLDALAIDGMTVLALEFLPDGKRCLALAREIAAPQRRAVMMVDCHDPAHPAASATLIIPGTDAQPITSHEAISVSPRGDRAIFVLSDLGYYTCSVTENPDAITLVNHDTDPSLLAVGVRSFFAHDGDRYFAVSEPTSAVAVHDFSTAQFLVVVSGDQQTGVVSEPLSAPLRVRVTTSLDEQHAEPIADVPVTFTVSAGDGRFVANGAGQQVVATDVNGTAQVTWVLGPEAGTGQTVTIAAEGLAGSPATVTATAVPDPANLPLTVVAILPEMDATDVGTTDPVLVVFSRAVDPASVEAGGGIRLHLDGDPTPVGVRYGYAGEGRSVSLVPQTELDAEATYVIDVTTAMRDEGGGALTTPVASSYYTRSANLGPRLYSINPVAGRRGVEFVISGTGFVSPPADNLVSFDDPGRVATVVGGTADYLVGVVPNDAPYDRVEVAVEGMISPTLEFLVLENLDLEYQEVLLESVHTTSPIRGIAVVPDELIAYGLSPDADTVVPIDLGELIVGDAIPVGDNPYAVVAHSDLDQIYVANLLSNSVSVIDRRSHTLQEDLPVGANPIDLALRPDGRRLFVAHLATSELWEIDTAPGSSTRHETLHVYRDPEDLLRCLAISPDGAWLYFGTNDGYAVYDTNERGVIVRVDSGAASRSVVVSPDGNLLIVLTTEGVVEIYDLVPGSPTEHSVVARIAVGSAIRSAEVSPDGQFIYLLLEEDDLVVVIQLTVIGAVGVMPAGSEIPPTSVTWVQIATFEAGEDPSDIAFAYDTWAHESHYVPRILTVIPNAGDSSVSVFGRGLSVGAEDVPAHAFVLNQNAPNPFNARTSIRFSLAGPGHVDLDVYDLRGRLVAHLVGEEMAIGPHDVIWNGTGLSGAPVASGIYFVRLEAGGRVATRKLALVK